MADGRHFEKNAKSSYLSNFFPEKVLTNLEDTAEKAFAVLRWRRAIDFDDNQRTSGPGVCTFPLYQL